MFAGRHRFNPKEQITMKVMKWSVMALAVAAGTSQMAVASQQSESKGFVEDASLDLLLRNTYWNRDFREGGINDAKPWGQGFIATFESGFTQGTIGVGVDAFGLLGVRLDGGGGHNFSQMFEFESDDDPERDVAQAGAAIKFQFSNTIVKYGDQMPFMPVLAYDDSRLLPQTFTGTLITTNEVDGLELNAGRFTAESSMWSASHDDAQLNSIDVLGGTYQFTDNLSASLYFSDVEDVYKKKYANVNYVMPLAESQALAFDFNIYKTDLDSERFGNQDENTIWSLSAKYSVGAHAFILAHQRISGDTGYIYDNGDGGSAIWVANSFLSDFNAKDERSWQASYELDFSAYGVPGLAWKTAYIRGDNIDAEYYGGTGEGKEREIFNQVSYTVQSGPAKDLTLRARNSILRTSTNVSDPDVGYVPDIDEWRLFVEYPLSIL